MSDQWPGTPVASAEQWPGTRVEGARVDNRSATDRLLGIGGERYQTWPERAVRSAAALPGRLFEAAYSAPAGSREQLENMVGPSFETAMTFTPISAAMRAARAARPTQTAPTTEQIGAASGRQYGEARAAGLSFRPEAVSGLADTIASDLTQAGYRDYLTPKTFRALEELKGIAKPTYADVEGVRQLLNRAAVDPIEKDAVRRAIGIIDHFVENLSEREVVTDSASAAILGPPAAVGELAGKARANWSAKRRAETISEALEKAERQAGSSHSGANTDNAIRQQIKAIRNSPKKSRGFTNEELAQMDRIIEGTGTGNLARTAGNVLGGGGGLGSALIAGGGALAAGPLGMMAPLVGYGLKQAGAASTRRQVDMLLEMIRRGSPEAAERGASEFAVPGRTGGGALSIPGRAVAPLSPASALAPDVT